MMSEQKGEGVQKYLKFADKEGEGVQKSQNFVDVLCGTRVFKPRGRAREREQVMVNGRRWRTAVSAERELVCPSVLCSSMRRSKTNECGRQWEIWDCYLEFFPLRFSEMFLNSSDPVPCRLYGRHSCISSARVKQFMLLRVACCHCQPMCAF